MHRQPGARAMKFLIATTALLLSVTHPAMAAEIVALGASNTEGKGRGATPDGVPRNQAFPAQLQALLAREGCKAKVMNAGVAGDTTDGMLRRLPRSLQKDTKVLILQPGGNDARQGGNNRSGNIAEMQRIAGERGIKVVMFERPASIAPSDLAADGVHFTAAGHARFAAWLAPQVRSAGACS